MKTCLICMNDADGDCQTCPKCGEASWAAMPTAEPSIELVTEKVQPKRPRRR